MASAIPCKHKIVFYIIIHLLILGMIPCGLFIAFGHSSKLGIPTHQVQDRSAEIAIIVEVILSITINSSLLIFYIMGLHNLSKIYPDNPEDQLLDTRIHEIVIEQSRYVVLFAILMVCDLIFGVIYLVMRCGEYDNTKVTSIVFIMALFQMILLIQSVFLSFKFKYGCYKKICYYCDEFVRDKFKKNVKKRNRDDRYLIPGLNAALLDDRHL